jgi:Spy/CpxP family protein refolding chaperone
MPWRNVALVILVVAAATALAAAAGEQSRRPHGWWKSTDVKALLELTDEESRTLDTIYRKALPKLHESMRRLNAEESTLSGLVGNMDIEEIDVTRQIDRMEATRSELSKTRILMLFRMYRVLTEDQRTRLDKWMTQENEEGTARTLSGRR